MNILWLTKRHYTGRDVVSERYGRQFHLPFRLAGRGHRVTLSVLSYDGRGVEEKRCGRMKIRAQGFFPSFGRGYYRSLAGEKPDVVVAGSDAPFAFLAKAVASRRGIPFVVDCHDDFSSYASARLPYLHRKFLEVLPQAGFVSCVSEPLERRLRAMVPHARLERLENATDLALFYPYSRAACRREWAGATLRGTPIFGYAGAWHANRGVATLLRAWPRVREKLPDAELWVAGRGSRRLSGKNGVRDFGDIPPGRVPRFLSALDVALVLTFPNRFGQSCFPMKFGEAVACGVPVVSAAQGALLPAFRNLPRATFAPGNPESLARSMVALYESPALPEFAVSDWDERAARFGAWLERTLS